MAEVVPFPIPAAEPPRSCGWLEFGPFHVWPDDATLGDACQCGAVTLSIDPATLPELVPD